jgi:hypothetical protein
MSFLTGKRAKNRAFEWLQERTGPAMQQQMAQGQRFAGAFEGAMGLGDDAQFNQGFQRFQNASGFRNTMDSAMRGVQGSAAARGLMGSGATLRAMQDRAAGLGQQSYNNYLGQIMAGQQNAFGNAANMSNTIAGAGQTGGSQGLLGAIGQAAGGAASAFKAFSDRRLKEDIVRLETRPDGLGVYEYTLKTDGQRYIGVMADEVAKMRPEALGPTTDGFATVYYDRL